MFYYYSGIQYFIILGSAKAMPFVLLTVCPLFLTIQAVSVCLSLDSLRCNLSALLYSYLHVTFFLAEEFSHFLSWCQIALDCCGYESLDCCDYGYLDDAGCLLLQELEIKLQDEKHLQTNLAHHFALLAVTTLTPIYSCVSRVQSEIDS